MTLNWVLLALPYLGENPRFVSLRGPEKRADEGDAMKYYWINLDSADTTAIGMLWFVGR